ncbi:MAG: transporter substrate-binding domain-containing protein, partial [Clostridia bacterium]|nr:transporter substrate-binding domain-containing protein [Clostridia bacterium]
MKKIIALLLMLVMLVGCFASCGGNNTDADDGSSNAASSDLAYIQGKGKIVIGITDYAPMNYKEEGSTEWTGFDTEFAQKFAEELGV